GIRGSKERTSYVGPASHATGRVHATALGVAFRENSFPENAKTATVSRAGVIQTSPRHAPR
ncbi:MAG: hypothetical protein ACRYG8_07360, partial [Janthinobacterium lividum]